MRGHKHQDLKLNDIYNINLTNYQPHRYSITNLDNESTPAKDSLENSVVDHISQIPLSIEVKTFNPRIHYTVNIEIQAHQKIRSMSVHNPKRKTF
jgi:hypothetical protein